MQKPALFIASSVEGLSVADAVNLVLDHDTQNTLWRTGTFKLGSSGLTDLVKKSSVVDFAVFIFTPDDLLTIRDKQHFVARDNVVFELGLFIGSLGIDRCYVIKPRGIDMHIPSDLLGITTADYEPNRTDGDVASALNAACKLIKDRVNELGVTRRSPTIATPGKNVPNPAQFNLKEIDLAFLAQCVQSYVSSPSGMAFQYIRNEGELKKQPEYLVSLSAVKLTKLGYVEKLVEHDDRDGYDYYAYRATDDGIDVFLSHEAEYSAILSTPTIKKLRPSKPTKSGFDDMDDDIPF